MDLDSRVVEDTKRPASEQGTPPTANGVKFQAVVQQASPISSSHPTSPSGTIRRGSLPVLHEDRLRPEIPGANSDPASRVPSIPRSQATGLHTPPRRRSVQFARGSDLETPLDGSPESPQSGFTGFLQERRGVSLLSKLKALTTSSTSNGHFRSPSGQTVGNESIDNRFGMFTPDSEFMSGPESPENITPLESDADSEGSPHEGAAGPSKARRRRKSRRPQDGGAQTAPATPKTPFEPERPHLFSWHSSASGGERRRAFLRRRATMDDIRSERQGVSEDEGRQQLGEDGLRSRGADLLRGISYGRLKSSHHRAASENPRAEDTTRPGTFRRALTGMMERHEGEPSPWKIRSDKTASLSAAKWKQIKAGLKMIGRQKKAQITIDHAKSAELLAELSAGTPAALMLASMFLRDERGNRRVPILLEQVKVRILNNQADGEKENRFLIELEYGNGLTRMKWQITRHTQDFFNLHTRLKLQRRAQQVNIFKKDDPRAKVPRFPRKSFPGFRNIPGAGVSDSEGEEEVEDPTRNDASGNERPVVRGLRSFHNIRRKSSTPGPPGLDADATLETRKERAAAKARENLEAYLQQIIRYVMFRPESNRLCRFLEISALGVRLAAEDSYHGKEGYLRIITGKGVDFRRTLTQPSTFANRHDSKWFLVRHSYIVCVDSPEAMNIYDVFLLDSDFNIEMRKDESTRSKAKSKTLRRHVLKVSNSERKMKLLVQHERQLDQWNASINQIMVSSPWSKKHRFDSFAPVRTNVFAQWLVDGRDYMWNVSRAISMAKDVIYIHDWWLSPELYMRRPACISKKWRLDRLLQRKAKEGVKIFVIVYRNINSAIPIDSEYTKFSLLDLHSNVFVQRSPNQIRQGTFFWAHHEKILIVDHMVAFVGGIDLCFGRWDTPQHEVADDKLTGFEDVDVARNADNCQLWPGKDYSNPRVQDFFDLDQPYEEMYDRSRTARMPWHDISMQVVGQPARDLTRHFVQRWNYILRQRKPSRPTPFLLPPPELNPADLEALGLNGTCEVQMLRSCGMWSMGTPNRTEHSIMTAYTQAIQKSEHFVYIENQFFISTCEMDNTRIENSIGDALVERILQAEENGDEWRAVIVIPLVPGFQNTVDSPDGTSIRLIMQCQYRSICRGESSIFGRLRASGINPDKYIKFFSLRSWGKIGPNKVLTTEQLYIHAKCMVVDDKIAIIGSANINERSMLGNRDSECAAIVRDTDMIWSTMAGQPYLVGRFPHTLRMRLMREHLGIDVDCIMHEQFMEQASSEEMKDGLQDLEEPQAGGPTTPEEEHQEKERAVRIALARTESLRSFNKDAAEEQANSPHLKSGKRVTRDPRIQGNADHKRDVEGYGFDRMLEVQTSSSRPRASSNLSKTTTGSAAPPEIGSDAGKTYGGLPPEPVRTNTTEAGLTQVSQLPALPKSDDTDIGGPPLQKVADMGSKAHPLLSNMKRPEVHQDCMRDPLATGFYDEIWDTVARNNTAIFRAVFRCQPDDEVTRWAEYKAYAAYAERFNQSQGGGRSGMASSQDRPGASGPPGAGPVNIIQDTLTPTLSNHLVPEKVAEIQEKVKETIRPGTAHSQPRLDGTVQDWAADADAENEKRVQKEGSGKDGILDEKASLTQKASNDSSPKGKTIVDSPSSAAPVTEPDVQRKRSRKGTAGNASRREFRASDDVLSKEAALNLLQHVQGHLIVWPYEWLAREEQGGRWLFPIDQLAPLEIYN